MKFTHRRKDVQFRKFLWRNTYWAVSLIATACVLLGGGISYSYFKAEVTINTANIKSNKADIITLKTEIKQARLLISGNTDYINLMYKFISNEQATAKAKGDVERQEKLDKVMKQIKSLSNKMLKKEGK